MSGMCSKSTLSDVPVILLIGTVLLSCSQTDSTDHLWLLSNDCFPFQNILSEGQSTLSIDGKVWALEEIPHVGRYNNFI